MSGDIYLLNHLPKCAGNAIAEHFRVLFGEVATFEVRTEDNPLELLPRYRLLYGHITREYEERIAGGRRRFTMVRDPIDRVISNYYFLHQLDSTHDGYQQATTMSLSDFVQCDDPAVRAIVENRQATQLFGLSAEEILQGREEEIFERHSTQLDRFDIIGVYERFQESLDVISWSFRLPRLNGNVRVNTTKMARCDSAIDNSTFNLIRKKNRLDELLYQYAQSHFSALHREMMESLLSAGFLSQECSRGFRELAIDFEQGVPGTGWYQAEYLEGWYRWMGPEPGASVYFPVAVNKSDVIKIYVRYMFPGVNFSDIGVKINGKDASFVVTEAEGIGYFVEVSVPDKIKSFGTRINILSKKRRAPTAEDSRELAIAVSRIEIVTSSSISHSHTDKNTTPRGGWRNFANKFARVLKGS